LDLEVFSKRKKDGGGDRIGADGRGCRGGGNCVGFRDATHKHRACDRKIEGVISSFVEHD